MKIISPFAVVLLELHIVLIKETRLLWNSEINKGNKVDLRDVYERELDLVSFSRAYE